MSNKKTKVMLVFTTLMMAITLSACGHEHEWERATCTEPRECISCGETDGEPKGHDWIDATETSPRTCDRCGKTEGEVLGDAPGEAVDSNEPLLSEIVGNKLSVGDTFTLGTYEQDNDLNNGAEDIEWVVIQNKGNNEYLCISKFVLDSQVFGYDGLEIRNRWSTSYLRDWLNDSFYNTAFTEADKRNLVNMTTKYWTIQTADSVHMYKDTVEDMVRVLNFDELDLYPYDYIRFTSYAKKQGKLDSDSAWWDYKCYMMTYLVDWVETIEKEHSSKNDVNGYTFAQRVSGVALYYDHTAMGITAKNSISSSYEPYASIKDDKADEYLEGVQPVITIKLTQD